MRVTATGLKTLIWLTSGGVVCRWCAFGEGSLVVYPARLPSLAWRSTRIQSGVALARLCGAYTCLWSDRGRIAPVVGLDTPRNALVPNLASYGGDKAKPSV